MDEARSVVARLDRIESLRQADAPAAQLLPELRALLREGERWVAAEGGGTRAARLALRELERRLPAAERVATGVEPVEGVVAAIGG